MMAYLLHPLTDYKKIRADLNVEESNRSACRLKDSVNRVMRLNWDRSDP